MGWRDEKDRVFAVPKRERDVGVMVGLPLPLSTCWVSCAGIGAWADCDELDDGATLSVAGMEPRVF